MGLNHRAYKIVMFIFATGAVFPAWSAEPLAPLSMEARYEVAWGGIPIGRIRLTATEAAGNYHMVVDTKTSGIAKLFSDEKRTAEVEGHGGAGQPYVPSSYKSLPQKEGDGRTVIRYDTTGHIDSIDRTPQDDPKWRPLVPREQANTATDPITAGYTLRQKMHDSLPNAHEFTMRTYDGARLAEMKFTLVNADETLEIMDKKISVVNMRVSRQPIIGYTPKELKKFAKGDPEIHLYFSNNARFLPVRATIESGFGQITATLEKSNTPL